MICGRCQKNAASVSYEETINGHMKKYALCAECAKELNFGGGFGENFAFSPFSFLENGGLLGSMFGESRTPQGKRCPLCKMTFADIARTGKVGCGECYRAFEKELRSTLSRIHGAATHTGKRYEKAVKTEEAKKATQKGAEPTMEGLRKRLAQAIEAEAFEEAARLRDEIKKLEMRGASRTSPPTNLDKDGASRTLPPTNGRQMKGGNTNGMV